MRRSTSRRKDPANSQSSATQQDTTKRDATAGTTYQPWSAAARPDGTRPESRIKHRMTPYASESHGNFRLAQRLLSRCHEARPARTPKRIDEAALPTKTPVFDRHSP